MKALGRLRQQRRHDAVVDIDDIKVSLSVGYRLVEDLANGWPGGRECGTPSQRQAAETDKGDREFHIRAAVVRFGEISINPDVKSSFRLPPGQVKSRKSLTKATSDCAFIRLYRCDTWPNRDESVTERSTLKIATQQIGDVVCQTSAHSWHPAKDTARRANGALREAGRSYNARTRNVVSVSVPTGSEDSRSKPGASVSLSRPSAASAGMPSPPISKGA